MSRPGDFPESRKAYRIFGEDEESTGGDSDLDILKTERKNLELSESIKGMAEITFF